TDDPSVLSDHDAICISMHFDRTTDRACDHGVFVVVEADQTGLGDRRWHGMESIEPAGIGNQLWPLCLEYLPDRPIGELRMPVCLGIGNAPVGKPGVHLVEALEAQPRREEPLAD